MPDYSQLISQFQNQVKGWNRSNPDLQWDLSRLCQYPVKNAVVFNNDLFGLDPAEIKFILVGDNPGREEQLQKRYLIGKAGQTARNFFQQKLDIDFDRQVLVLNKTPIHSIKTSDLSRLSGSIVNTLIDSQIYMASLTYGLQKTIGCPVFVTGFSGCRTPDGVWLKRGRNGYPKTMTLPYYFETLKELGKYSDFTENLYIFRHFSYGNFAKDFAAGYKNGESPLKTLYNIGEGYRRELVEQYSL